MKIPNKPFFSKASPSAVLGLRWLAPFGGFLVGYLMTGYLFHRAELPTPHVIGKPLYEAVQMLSNARLGLRLLAQREEPTLAEGTVLDQLPCPGQRTRPNQNVFVTISTKQPQLQTPDWWGKRVKDVTSEIEQKGLVAKVFWLAIWLTVALTIWLIATLMFGRTI